MQIRFGAIVLALPFLDMLLLLPLSHVWGKALWLWLLFASCYGIYLLRQRPQDWRSMLQQPTGKGLYYHGGRWVAGGLLLWPGLLSDLIALGILWWVRAKPSAHHTPRASHDPSTSSTLIEGECRRVDD